METGYSKNLKTINSLANICYSTLKKLKIGSVAKHIPGHGSSKVDTHKKISIVNTSVNSLMNNDFEALKYKIKFCNDRAYYL